MLTEFLGGRARRARRIVCDVYWPCWTKNQKHSNVCSSATTKMKAPHCLRLLLLGILQQDRSPEWYESPSFAYHNVSDLGKTFGRNECVHIPPELNATKEHTHSHMPTPNTQNPIRDLMAIMSSFSALDEQALREIRKLQRTHPGSASTTSCRL